MTTRLVAGLLVCLTACTSEDPSAGLAVRSDSAGVEIVQSPGVDVLLARTFAADWSIGGDPDGLATFFSVDARSAAADTEGRFYVLDRTNARVVQIEADGTASNAFGQAGEGPGELGGPASLGTDGGGVAVFDFAKMSLVRFTFLGETRETMPFRHPPAPTRQRHFAEVGGSYWVSTVSRAAQGDGMRYVLQRLGPSGDSAVVEEVPLPPSNPQRYLSCGGGLNLPPLFEPEIVWAVAGPDVAVSASPQYQIDVFRDGQRFRSVRRDLPATEATRSLAMDELGEGMRINFGSGPCTIPPAEMVEKRGYADLVPRIERIALAPSGELWVQRRVVGAPGTGPIDVFDPEGAYIGTLPSDFPFPLVFDQSGRIGIAQRDEDDIERLVVGRVQEMRE